MHACCKWRPVQKSLFSLHGSGWCFDRGLDPGKRCHGENPQDKPVCANIQDIVVGDMAVDQRHHGEADGEDRRYEKEHQKYDPERKEGMDRFLENIFCRVAQRLDSSDHADNHHKYDRTGSGQPEQ